MHKYNILYAYAIGYFHGRSVGVEENLYCGHTQAEENSAYSDGYERGIVKK